MSKTAHAYASLKQDLLNGVFAPSSKLRIDALCDRYNVSPGAVREALSRLVAEGLANPIEQRGFVVAPISAADLIDLTAVRIDVETKCLARAIQIGDLDWEAGIAAAWHRLSHSPKLDPKQPGIINPAWTEAHGHFHDALISASDSLWWLKLRSQLKLQTERYRRLLMPYAKVERDVDAEHEVLVAAIMRRDVEISVSMMRDHMQRTADILLASDAPFIDSPPAAGSMKEYHRAP